MELREIYSDKEKDSKQFPKDWLSFPLGDLLTFKNGLNKESKYFGYGTPIINYMDVFNNNSLFNKDIEGKVFLNFQEKKNFSAKNGDVFFTRTSETQEEIGSAAVLLEDIEDCVFSGFVLRGRPYTNLVDKHYFQYCLTPEYVRSQIFSMSSYTTRALTNGTSLAKVNLVVPPTPNEQKAIAQVLSDTDALIQALKKKIVKKKLIKKGVMQKLLTPKKGWEVKSLGEVCDIRKGQLITSDTKIDGAIPVIAGGKKPAYFHNKPNRTGKTITISASGANAGYVSFHNYEIFASDCSTISESKTYSIEYIYFVLLRMQDAIYKMQTGGAQPHIHPCDINPIEFPFPSLQEQKQIAIILTDIDAEISQLNQKLTKYQLAKQGMMQQLLTGKIRLA